MSNKLQFEPAKPDLKRDEREIDERETLNYRIKKQVIDALGKPSDLRNVQIRKVWEGHFRVNVFVGTDAGSVRIANSYFLAIDKDGSLITATPKIMKQY